MQIPEHLLIPNIQKWVDLKPEEANKILSAFEAIQVEKRKQILKPGEISKYIYFIVQGVVRSFFVDEKGVEHIYQIRLENGWIGDLESFLSQKPANFYLETLEPSILLQITNEGLEGLYREVPKLERYFRILFQNAYINALQRLNSTMWTTAEERYQELVKENCDILQRVPQAYIASYLGITPESLSRIRKKKN